MALIKKIKTNLGIDATYWKIVDLNINWLTKTSHIAMCGWLDEQVRLDDKQPLTSESFDWSGDNFPFTDTEPQNERELAYQKIKEPVLNETGENINFFTDAEDC